MHRFVTGRSCHEKFAQDIFGAYNQPNNVSETSTLSRVYKHSSSGIIVERKLRVVYRREKHHRVQRKYYSYSVRYSVRADFINAFIFPYFSESKIAPATGKCYRVQRTYLCHRQICVQMHARRYDYTRGVYAFGWQLLNLRNSAAYSAHASYYRARSACPRRCATCAHSKTWFSC